MKNLGHPIQHKQVLRPDNSDGIDADKVVVIVELDYAERKKLYSWWFSTEESRHRKKIVTRRKYCLTFYFIINSHCTRHIYNNHK